MLGIITAIMKMKGRGVMSMEIIVQTILITTITITISITTIITIQTGYQTT